MIAILLACAAPSMLVVVTDTVGADLGGAPWPAWATPATGAAVYTDAAAPSSWTGPSTGALLTGDLLATPATLRPYRFIPTTRQACWPDAVITDNVTVDVAARFACSELRSGVLPAMVPAATRAEAATEAARAAMIGNNKVVAQILAAHMPVEGGSMRDMLAAEYRDDPPPDIGSWRGDAYRTALLDTLPMVGDLVADAVADGWIVVWTSDHGEALGPDRWDHGLDLEVDQVKVPLAVWGPGVAPGWYDEPTSTLCIADLARGDRGLLTGDCDRPAVSAMIVDGEWVERVYP